MFHQCTPNCHFATACRFEREVARGRIANGFVLRLTHSHMRHLRERELPRPDPINSPLEPALPPGSAVDPATACRSCCGSRGNSIHHFPTMPAGRHAHTSSPVQTDTSASWTSFAPPKQSLSTPSPAVLLQTYTSPPRLSLPRLSHPFYIPHPPSHIPHPTSRPSSTTLPKYSTPKPPNTPPPPSPHQPPTAPSSRPTTGATGRRGLYGQRRGALLGLYRAF